MLSRRGLVLTLMAAPAVVRSTSLMRLGRHSEEYDMAAVAAVVGGRPQVDITFLAASQFEAAAIAECLTSVQPLFNQNPLCWLIPMG